MDLNLTAYIIGGALLLLVLVRLFYILIGSNNKNRKRKKVAKRTNSTDIPKLEGEYLFTQSNIVNQQGNPHDTRSLFQIVHQLFLQGVLTFFISLVVGVVLYYYGFKTISYVILFIPVFLTFPIIHSLFIVHKWYKNLKSNQAFKFIANARSANARSANASKSEGNIAEYEKSLDIIPSVIAYLGIAKEKEHRLKQQYDKLEYLESELEELEEIYNAALPLADDNVNFYISRSLFRREFLYDYEAALDDAMTAFQIDPNYKMNNRDNVDPQTNLKITKEAYAELKFILGDYQAVIDTYEELFELVTEKPTLLRAYNYFFSLRPIKALRELVKVIVYRESKHFTRTVKRNVSKDHIQYIAISKLRLQQSKEAIELFKTHITRELSTNYVENSLPLFSYWDSFNLYFLIAYHQNSLKQFRSFMKSLKFNKANIVQEEYEKSLNIINDYLTILDKDSDEFDENVSLISKAIFNGNIDDLSQEIDWDYEKRFLRYPDHQLQGTLARQWLLMAKNYDDLAENDPKRYWKYPYLYYEYSS